MVLKTSPAHKKFTCVSYNIVFVFLCKRTRNFLKIPSEIPEKFTSKTLTGFFFSYSYEHVHPGLFKRFLQRIHQEFQQEWFHQKIHKELFLFPQFLQGFLQHLLHRFLRYSLQEFLYKLLYIVIQKYLLCIDNPQKIFLEILPGGFSESLPKIPLEIP